MKHGAAVDAAHPEGSPFIHAISWSRFDSAKTLLELGADVNQSHRGMTALHLMLSKSSDKQHFRMIASYGPRGDLPNNDGKTAAQIMSRKRDPYFRELAERLQQGDRGRTASRARPRAQTTSPS